MGDEGSSWEMLREGPRESGTSATNSAEPPVEPPLSRLSDADEDFELSAPVRGPKYERASRGPPGPTAPSPNLP